MSQISVRGLSLGYENQIVAKNISFDVERGDYLAIVGENGSGKSTLVKTLLGLEKPIDGEILLGDGLKRTEIGYLPQKTEVDKDFPGSCFEIVLTGFLGHSGFKPFYTKEQKEKAMDSMELLDISELKNVCYRNLSGGQQQRVLLARALCATDKLIILDEPVSGLDPEATFEMYGIIRNLNHNHKVTIVMISHDITAVDKYANHVLKLGKEVAFK